MDYNGNTGCLVYCHHCTGGIPVFTREETVRLHYSGTLFELLRDIHRSDGSEFLHRRYTTCIAGPDVMEPQDPKDEKARTHCKLFAGLLVSNRYRSYFTKPANQFSVIVVTILRLQAILSVPNDGIEDVPCN